MTRHNAALTPKQTAILEYITHRRANGYPPTLREIAAEFGIRNTNGIVCHINALERKGFVRNNGKARGIEPTTDPIAILVHEAYNAVNTLLQHGLSAAALTEALKHFRKGSDYGNEAGKVHGR